ncbi:MAG: LysR family transcriptional regulator [Oscillospiraceae bacterium]|nr:LysR family transcriptional regulator [Oscillospiraceae bacterium]
MNPQTKLYLLNEQGQRFFGDGPCRLLKLVEETGSLRAAAQEMGMAYTKAMRLLRQAELAMDTPLTERVIGGTGGGGSRLTKAGKELVEKYEQCRMQCVEANRRICAEIFGGNG